MTFAARFLEGAREILSRLEPASIEACVQELIAVRERGGRLFILGVGGSAANASHAVNDFRKLCGIEAYAPTDNVAELSARTNDDGWENTFAPWLETSRLTDRDLILVFSVGGGDLPRNVSPNLVRALEFAQKTRSPVIGVVGRDGGMTAKVAKACVLVPSVEPSLITPYTEAFQGVLAHLFVSDPRLQNAPTKW